MSDRSSFLLLVISVLLAIGFGLTAFIYGQRQSCARTQQLASGAGMATAVIGFIGLVVLAVYTRETFLLRKTAEQQIENGIMPVVQFDLSTKERVLGQSMAFNAPHLRNVGVGPAFNVKVRPLVGNGAKVEIDDVPLIEARHQADVTFKISENGECGGFTHSLEKLGYMIENGKFPARMTVTVECEALSRRHYQTVHEISYDADAKRVQTSFRGIEPTKIR